MHDLDAVVFSQTCGGEKPNPAAFAETVRMLELSAEQLIMVGDNWMRDGVGAINAGLARAFIVRREPGTHLGGQNFNCPVAQNAAGIISEVPNLTSMLYACMDAQS